MRTAHTQTVPFGPAPSVVEESPARAAAFRLPAQAEQVAEARSLLRERLDHWQIDPGLRDDAVLILSELFTNAVVHTDSTVIACHIDASRTLLYLATVDEGAGSVRAQSSEPDAEGGRGLFIVGALAERWGVVGRPGSGRTVWATLRISR